MPSYNCKHPTCLILLPSRGYCPKHQQVGDEIEAERQQVYDQKLRSREAKKFYCSLGWNLARTLKLASAPTCQRCSRQWSTDVHHVISVREILSKGLDRSLLTDQNNLQSLCGICHKRIEGRKKRGKSAVNRE